MATDPASRTGSASLRGRLVRVVGVLAIALIAMCAFATIGLTRLGGAIGLILKENYVSVVASEEMNEALDQQDAAAYFLATGHEDRGRPLLVAHRAAFAAAFAKEAANITLPGEGELVRDVDVLYRDYVATVDRVLADAPERRVERYFSEIAPRLRKVKSEVTKVRVVNQANMEWADGEARAVARHTLAVALFISCAALLLVGYLIQRLSVTILAPLATFTDRARAIGDGRLDTRVPLPDVSELRTLADALGRMQEKLRAYRESSLGELLAAKDLARATIASIAEPVLVFGAHGELLLANDAADAIFRLGGEASSVDAPIPEAIARARDAMLGRREAEVSQASLADAMRWGAPDGERYFLVRASPLVIEDGARGAIVLAQDVTRFRRIDALKSDVVATASHELKTPLTALRLSTHMLLDETSGALTEVQRELATTARDATERLQATVDELLDLVRIERDAGALRRSAVTTEGLLRVVADRAQAEAGQKGISLVVDVSGATSLVVDPEQMAIAIGNLTSNAIRHSRAGSSVCLGAEDTKDDVVLSVRDEGEGIAPRHLASIFERHWTGAALAGSERHGLGLAIAKEIVERHGGTIEVESELGRGTLFRIRLPSAGARGPS